MVCMYLFISRDCIAVEGPKPDAVPDRKRYGPMKLLQFRENYRPAYWGTWSKKSAHISPRCPFRQDKVKKTYIFFYYYYLSAALVHEYSLGSGQQNIANRCFIIKLFLNLFVGHSLPNVTDRFKILCLTHFQNFWKNET